MSREKWLNGFKRTDTWVYIGPAVHCAGCGKFFGVVCVSITGYSPDINPDWPFDQATCPVCETHRKINEFTATELSVLPASTLRRALIENKFRNLA